MLRQSECTLSKFGDDTKLGRVAGRPEGCTAVQRNLDRLEEWAHGKLMKLNKVKRKVFHLWGNNHRHHYMLGAMQLESSFEENDLRS